MPHVTKLSPGQSEKSRRKKNPASLSQGLSTLPLALPMVLFNVQLEQRGFPWTVVGSDLKPKNRFSLGKERGNGETAQTYA